MSRGPLRRGLLGVCVPLHAPLGLYPQVAHLGKDLVAVVHLTDGHTLRQALEIVEARWEPFVVEGSPP